MLISFVLKEKNDLIPLKVWFRGRGGVTKGIEASVLNKHHKHAFIDTVKISNTQEVGKGCREALLPRKILHPTLSTAVTTFPGSFMCTHPSALTLQPICHYLQQHKAIPRG